MPDQAPQPAIKKQKTGEDGENKKKKKTQTVKAVKAVDPAVIEQRRDAVQSRVLKLENKLAKDRALLAKYSVQASTGKVSSSESDEDE